MRKFLLSLWMILPLVPILITVYFLNRYGGILENLRLLVGLILICFTLSVTFLGWWSIRKNKVKAMWSIAILCGFFLAGSSYFTYVNLSVYQALNQMIVNQQSQEYSLVVMTGQGIEKRDHLEGGRIGVIQLADEQGNAIIESFLEESQLGALNELIFYESPLAMLHDLYNDKVEAIIIASGFQALLREREGFQNIEADTKVLENIKVTTEQSPIRPGSLMDSPFSILLIGVDSLDHLGGLADAIILATVNPQNLSITMTSIPRDSYVHLPAHGYMRDKIAHASNSGPQAVVSAVEFMYGMEIPYHITVNFSAVVELVDALGGIEVDVPISFREQNSRRQFGNHMIEVEAGRQILDGEQALALARHRSTLPLYDLGRAAHQQLVLESILRQILVETSTINDFLMLLNVFSNHIETNLSIGEMTSVMQFLLDQLPNFRSPNPMDYVHIINMVLSGVYGDVMTPWFSFPLSMFFPFNGALADTFRFMDINLGNEEPPMFYSFSFNGFEPFSSTRWIPQLYFEDPRWEPLIPPGTREPELDEAEEGF